MFDNDETAPHIELIELVNELINERHNTHSIIKTGKSATTTHTEAAHHRVLAATTTVEINTSTTSTHTEDGKTSTHTEESHQTEESHTTTSKTTYIENLHTEEGHTATVPPIHKDAHVIKLDMQKSFFATVPLNGN